MSEQKQKLHIKKIFGYYWPHIKKYPRTGLFLMLFYAGGTLSASIALPLVYRSIADTMAQASQPADVAETLSFLVVILGVLLITFNILYRIADYAMTYFQSNVLRDLTNTTFAKLQNHSYSFFTNNFSGALLTKAKRFTRSFETIHDKLIYNIQSSFLKTGGAIVVLLWLTPFIGTLFLLWVFCYIVFTFILIKYKMPRDLAEASADSAVTASFADVITNVLNVKMFSRAQQENEDFNVVTTFEERKRRNAWYFNNFMNLIQGILFVFLEFGIMFFAVRGWIDGSVSIGTILLIQAYLIATFDSVWGLGRALADIMKALADANEMVEIFEEPIDIVDPAQPQECKITNGRICFDRVTFAYEAGAKVFNNFTLTIPPGEKVGLIGHSGAGKTTITKLLLRFSDVTSGTIRIDGQDIRSVRQDELRSYISYVPQEPLLFHRTLRENIAYGFAAATDQEIISVAQKAHAHDFITALPQGYDTLVGERGVKLSGGERQRVAIARAMLKNAPILILDEATSSLDSISEKHIQAALAELMKGKTTIVIAHRLSTVQKMDRILVLADGEIVEEGTHQSLIAKKEGVYQKFWHEQTSSFLV